MTVFDLDERQGVWFDMEGGGRIQLRSLQNELFWDLVIVAWENFSDRQGNPIPCTKENKLLLLSRSQKFANFVSDSLKTLNDKELTLMEETEKN